MYADDMRGHTKGTDVQAELAALREAFARAAAAIWATYDSATAWRQATELAELVRAMESDAVTLRGQVILSLMELRGVNATEASRALGIDKAATSRLINRARKAGAIMTDTSDTPEQPTVALAIITRDGEVLVEQRRDGIPPWTFPGGEVMPGESARATAARRVTEETGLQVEIGAELGRRIHPKTNRQMVYLAAEVTGGELALLDTEDLAAVEWHSIDSTRTDMPDMFAPVRAHLDSQAQ
jgi:8-oxo-dGTP diphosphatase